MYMYHADCNLRPENIYVSTVSEIKYIRSTNRILKEIAVLECENAKNKTKKSKHARSALARIFIDFLNVSFLSVYCRLYI